MKSEFDEVEELLNSGMSGGGEGGDQSGESGVEPGSGADSTGSDKAARARGWINRNIGGGAASLGDKITNAGDKVAAGVSRPGFLSPEAIAAREQGYRDKRAEKDREREDLPHSQGGRFVGHLIIEGTSFSKEEREELKEEFDAGDIRIWGVGGILDADGGNFVDNIRTGVAEASLSEKQVTWISLGLGAATSVALGQTGASGTRRLAASIGAVTGSSQFALYLSTKVETESKSGRLRSGAKKLREVNDWFSENKWAKAVPSFFTGIAVAYQAEKVFLGVSSAIDDYIEGDDGGSVGQDVDVGSEAVESVVPETFSLEIDDLGHLAGDMDGDGVNDMHFYKDEGGEWDLRVDISGTGKFVEIDTWNFGDDSDAFKVEGAKIWVDEKEYVFSADKASWNEVVQEELVVEPTPEPTAQPAEEPVEEPTLEPEPTLEELPDGPWEEDALTAEATIHTTESGIHWYTDEDGYTYIDTEFYGDGPNLRLAPDGVTVEHYDPESDQWVSGQPPAAGTIDVLREVQTHQDEVNAAAQEIADAAQPVKIDFNGDGKDDAIRVDGKTYIQDGGGGVEVTLNGETGIATSVSGEMEYQLNEEGNWEVVSEPEEPPAQPDEAAAVEGETGGEEQVEEGGEEAAVGDEGAASVDGEEAAPAETENVSTEPTEDTGAADETTDTEAGADEGEAGEEETEAGEETEGASELTFDEQGRVVIQPGQSMNDIAVSLSEDGNMSYNDAMIGLFEENEDYFLNGPNSEAATEVYEALNSGSYDMTENGSYLWGRLEDAMHTVQPGDAFNLP